MMQTKNLAVDKVVIHCIRGLIFLFSALEEADWLVFSTTKNDNQIIDDHSPWNINNFLNTN